VRLSGKVAIVTGAGSGFGEGIACRYAGEGAKVIVNDINADSAERVTAAIQEAGGTAELAQADVSAGSGWAALMRSTLDAYGRLDVVVNNAGWTHRLKSLLEISEEEFDRVFAINVRSLFLSAKHAIPVFRRQGGGGCFVQIASTLAVRPRPGLAPYSSSKAAVINLSHSLAAEFGPEKIRFNVINPAFGLTGLAADFMGGTDTPEMRQKFLSLMPLGRFITPVDIANAALFLASDEAEIITGACLQVDAGRSI
jgi:3-oxoacyl-[acyl-carrier protein] reductase